MSLFEKYELPQTGERICVENGKLLVPDQPIIPFIEGDGTGPDIWAAASRVIDAAVQKAYGGGKKIAWFEVFAGEKAFHKFGEWLPNDTLRALSEYIVGIKGPLTTPVGGGIRSLNVALRQELDLYVCLRPVRYFQGVPSPVKKPEDVDMVIFRENSEDIYSGIEWAEGTAEVQRIIRFLQSEMGVKKIRFPETSGIGIKPVSRQGTARLVRAAIEYALKHGRKSVTLVHKGNIMKFTEGAFKNWGYEVAEQEYADRVFTWSQYDRIKETDGVDAANRAQAAAEAEGRLIVKDVIADAFLQQILTRASEYDVIVSAERKPFRMASYRSSKTSVDSCPHPHSEPRSHGIAALSLSKRLHARRTRSTSTLLSTATARARLNTRSLYAVSRGASADVAITRWHFSSRSHCWRPRLLRRLDCSNSAGKVDRWHVVFRGFYRECDYRKEERHASCSIRSRTNDGRILQPQPGSG